MATLPAKVADTAFSTGKTNQSKVVDVYANTPQASNLAQNQITSVLTGVGGDLLKGVEKILGGDKFVKGLTETTKAFLKGDPSSGEKVKSLLKEYKGGGLSGMLETGTVKELKSFGDGIVKGVEGNVKDLAFGSIKGFVDKIVPGVLDGAGVKSFNDAKKLYDGMEDAISDTRDMVTRIFSDDDDKNNRDVAALNTLVLDSSVQVINSILEPSQPITIRSTNIEIDNAILASSTTSLIEEDNVEINNKIFTAMENDEVRELYVSSVVDTAAEAGAINFLILAAEKTSDSFVKGNLYTSLAKFLTKVKFTTPETDAARTALQTKLIRAMSIFTGEADAALSMETFRSLPERVKDVMIFNTTYGPLVGMATAVQETTFQDTFSSSFPDLVE